MNIKLAGNFRNLISFAFLQVLNLIFNCLKFRDHLSLSSVCQRFMQAINDDITFMRTVVFSMEPLTELLLSLVTCNPEPKLMLTYRYVILRNFKNFGNLSVLELAQLQNVERLSFVGCKFLNTSEFVSVLKHCKRLTSVYTVKGTLFQDLASEPTEKFPNPLSRLIVDSPVCKSLDCFEKISHIILCLWDGWGVQDLAPFMSKHAAALTSMSIYKYDSNVLQLLVDTPELKLEHLSVCNFKSEQVPLIAQILANQGSALTKLEVHKVMVQPIYDVIRLHLVNLETLTLCVWDEHNIRLTDLKVLRKLKSLTVDFEEFENEYEIDVGEFSILEQLTINVYYDGEVNMFVFKRPNLTLKKLEMNGVLLNAKLLGQIPTMFPNLTSLELHSYVSIMLT
jgi:F-box domain